MREKQPIVMPKNVQEASIRECDYVTHPVWCLIHITSNDIVVGTSNSCMQYSEDVQVTLLHQFVTVKFFTVCFAQSQLLEEIL